MVNTLNDSNPAKSLLDIIKYHGLSSSFGTDIKCDKFALGIMKGIFIHISFGNISNAKFDSGNQIDKLFEITAGDPSRGNISLATESALEPGASVQVCYCLTSQS
jgi:hypothetical protein